MTTELLILVKSDATEEDIKEIAAELCIMPAVLGVYRYSLSSIETTHSAPEAVQ